MAGYYKVTHADFQHNDPSVTEIEIGRAYSMDGGKGLAEQHAEKELSWFGISGVQAANYTTPEIVRAYFVEEF